MRCREGHQDDQEPRVIPRVEGKRGVATMMRTRGEEQVHGRVGSSGLDTPGLAPSWSGQLGSPETLSIQVLR